MAPFLSFYPLIDSSLKQWYWRFSGGSWRWTKLKTQLRQKILDQAKKIDRFRAPRSTRTSTLQPSTSSSSACCCSRLSSSASTWSEARARRTKASWTRGPSSASPSSSSTASSSSGPSSGSLSRGSARSRWMLLEKLVKRSSWIIHLPSIADYTLLVQKVEYVYAYYWYRLIIENIMIKLTWSFLQFVSAAYVT